ncbi:MAG TPA: acetyl-CoA hydrolase/transferase C-terminal domain-containing protein [Dehalococcoidia bacterium]|nr:acetyl-CoA hydrolase/transferase C-terminal domain-containing protein [Dehalococcoidia bacterium]
MTVDASLSAFVKWWPEGEETGLTIETFFLLDQDRHLFHEGKMEYRIAPPYREDLSRWTRFSIDVFMTQVTPPDAGGWCSFGMSLWGARRAASEAKMVLAEINPRQVRTGGDNRIHVDEIDYFVETAPEWRLLRPPERNEEEAEIAQVICALVAAELIHDGDTFQLGTGKVPAALSLFLGDKVDLGVHTELIFGGIPQLVEAGVITGRRKNVKPGLVVGSSFGQLTEEERQLVAARPETYELYEMAWTNDIATIAAHDNMVAVNNALLADLTGQVTGESLGHRIYSGTGGGFAFPAGAMHARNGRSIIVLPSTTLVDGDPRSRIVATLPPGTVVTVPRHYADYFVTEYGIAHLRDKTLGERVGEMISIAHPDFRTELRRDVQAAGFI